MMAYNVDLWDGAMHRNRANDDSERCNRIGGQGQSLRLRFKKLKNTLKTAACWEWIDAGEGGMEEGIDGWMDG